MHRQHYYYCRVVVVVAVRKDTVFCLAGDHGGSVAEKFQVRSDVSLGVDGLLLLLLHIAK